MSPSDRLAPADPLVLPPRSVHVWRFALTATERRLAALHALLTEDERARADAFAFPHLRRRHIVARGTMRILLARYLRREPARIRFRCGAHGKPCLEDGGPERLEFNLAHADDVALLAVSAGRAVGIDVERIDPARACVEVAEDFFAPAEVAAFRALPASQQVEGFFNAWTRKEAYLKALGTGLSLWLDRFVVSLAPGAPAALLETGWDTADAGRWAMRDLDVGGGYAGAIVAAGQDWEVARLCADAANGDIGRNELSQAQRREDAHAAPIRVRTVLAGPLRPSQRNNALF